MLLVMDSCLLHQLFLPDEERMRIGDGDDRPGRSLSVNLRVMGYSLNSLR